MIGLRGLTINLVVHYLCCIENGMLCHVKRSKTSLYIYSQEGTIVTSMAFLL